ncbi:MAG: DEAD/DEAH box helicase [Desulfobacterales bacterium]|nr:DEAD/DEAH box helicase [Desulfobacterales bacterium]
MFQSIIEYHVYRAALEWNLTDPIVIEKRDDLKSDTRWRDKMEPYHHQVTNLITFCRRLPVTLLADDVGLGKTISAGLIISELISRSRISRVLIVCPKLLGPQWQEELRTKFNISSEIAIGKELISAKPQDYGAIITTYNSARLYLDSIPEDRFQMLVLDEAHKLRNLYGVENPPQVAKRFHKALEDRRFRFVLMLTATPIQNRLWDIYSLVDLLTVARGHQNPFGSDGMFARKFIADNRKQARQLKPEAREEFRSIVYGYMSRVRRGDAKLYFPERVVQMHKVEPTIAELKLIQSIAGPIQELNRLTQISILQALTSSPDALLAQMNNMAAKGTVSKELAETVRMIVTRMPINAKLNGLKGLIDRLKQENPESWRIVVFTGRLETQTTIQAFIEKHGLKVGIINGTSGARNQETIAKFRNKPPDFHVIVSTEAGSEGVNLQVANILVNYDLPWNPMIVEQRIGRVQRLASEHASVGVFNIMLRGTFEEYIVGRLMEKLQMASHAIGDIEALLEASGITGDDEKGVTGFDEKIRQLVIAALAGKDVEAATQKAEQSIATAKRELELEEENINTMLGGMDGFDYVGPRAPKLPPLIRTMNPSDFTLSALKIMGAQITQQSPDLFLVKENSGTEYIKFEDNINEGVKSTLYAPGTSAFMRLVSQIVATGIYDIEDIDHKPGIESEQIAREWVISFEGTPKSIEINDVQRCFNGIALVRIRATVAHDSYERLIDVACSSADHNAHTDRSGLGNLYHTIEDPKIIGINIDKLMEAAKQDAAIAEFCRFYLERRMQEMHAAEGDERKRKKLEDDFTPRLEITLVALQGKLHRIVRVKTHYWLDSDFEYHNILTIIPHDGQLIDAPEIAICHISGKTVPKTCLKQCQISGAIVMQHLLASSEISFRLALPELTVLCSLSGKRVLKDEVQLSEVSGRLVANSLLKTSPISGKRAEPEHFGRCEFTMVDVLNFELATSEVSGKRYRVDEQLRSAVSGKVGHKQEFIVCHETQQFLTMAEAVQCEVTGNYVRRGILETCAVTKKQVLPSELLKCSVTGKRALKKLFVTSNITGAYIIEEFAIKSASGKYCTPVETKPCFWSGNKFHPEDLHICKLTGLSIYFKFVTADINYYFQPLIELLNGIKRTSDAQELWNILATKVASEYGKGRSRVEFAALSPTKNHIAACVEVRTLFGLRVHHLGLVYSIEDQCIVGRIAKGRRTSKGWVKV